MAIVVHAFFTREMETDTAVPTNFAMVVHAFFMREMETETAVPTNLATVDHAFLTRETDTETAVPTNLAIVVHAFLIREMETETAVPINPLRVDQPFLIRDTDTSRMSDPLRSPLNSLDSPSLSGLPTWFLIHLPILPTFVRIPLRIPSKMFSPIGSVSFAGLWIPKASLKPSMKGLRTLSAIHLPTPNIASQIPFRMPATTFPPHSSIFSSKYCFAPSTASERNPPRRAARPPVIDPRPANTSWMMPPQSTAPRASARAFPTSHQLTPLIAAVSACRSPLTPDEKVWPTSSQSITPTKLLILSAMPFPRDFQLNVVTAPYRTSSAAWNRSAITRPRSPQSI